MKKHFSYILCVTLLLSMVILSVPGRHAQAAFSLDDERKLGREIYDKLKKNQFLLPDPRLNDYISSIGNRIMAQGDNAPFDYTFSIFNSSAINAFATPGGYIYINTGLIMAVENEAQLAGVIAHEIAHANARHVAAMIDKSRKLNMAALAAMVVGAFLGGGGEATAAIAAFSVAGAAQMQLKYSRDHEEEADRMGIAYLVNAGYYPQAMVEFLQVIRQHDFFSRTIPSYLKTHPGTDDRIFYLETLISFRYPMSGESNIVGNFTRMQASITLSRPELVRRQRQLQEELNKDPDNTDLLYAMAMTYEQLGQTGQSLQALKDLLSLAPNDADALEKAGLLYLKTGQAEPARLYLARATALGSASPDIWLALGRAHFALGNYQTALDSYLRADADRLPASDLDYHIAMAYGKLKQMGLSHYHFGLHFQKQNSIDSALSHFRRAIDFFATDSPMRKTIDERIGQIESSARKRR